MLKFPFLGQNLIDFENSITGIAIFKGLTSGNYYYKSGSELLPIISQTWENTEGKRGEIQVKCFNKLLEIPHLETTTVE